LPVRKRPKSIEAYDLCVRARKLNELTPQTSREARLLLEHAIALDPSYAEALGWLGLNLWVGWAHFGEPMEPNRRMAIAVAEKAVAIDPSDAGCRWILGHILGYERRWTESDAELAVAVELDPNCADLWADLSDFSVLAGRVSEGLGQIHKALRLNPYPAN